MLHVSCVPFLMEMVSCEILKRAIARKKLSIFHTVNNVRFLTTSSVTLVLETGWAGMGRSQFKLAEGSWHAHIKAQRKELNLKT